MTLIAYEMRNSPEIDRGIGYIKATRYLTVTTTAIDQDPIIGVIGVPRAYEPFSFFTSGTLYTCLCRSVKAHRVVDGANTYTVVCEYSTPELKELGSADSSTGGGGGVETPGGMDNPLLELPEVDMDGEKHREPITSIFDPTADTSDPFDPPIHPIQASNGEIYTDPPDRNASSSIVNFERNETLDSPVLLLRQQYNDSVNSDTVILLGDSLAPGQCYMEDIKAKRMTRQLPDGSTFAYLRVKYSVRLAPSFDIKIVDAGSWSYRDTYDPVTHVAVTIKEHFKSDDGVPLEKGFLDGHGRKLGVLDDPVYFTIRPYKRMPFAPLMLPTSWYLVS